jgi:hypothetical protein
VNLHPFFLHWDKAECGVVIAVSGVLFLPSNFDVALWILHFDFTSGKSWLAVLSSENPASRDQTIPHRLVRIEILFSPTCNACDGTPIGPLLRFGAGCLLSTRRL